jgi:hypothetical protein
LKQISVDLQTFPVLSTNVAADLRVGLWLADMNTPIHSDVTAEYVFILLPFLDWV